MFSSPQGINSLVKEGGRHMSGLEEATFRNISACEKLSTITRTSLGPNSMNKLVINHLDRHYVTSDAATMLRELEVQHPAAKLLIMASKMQEEECGDATNFTVILAGELLAQAAALLKEGIHMADIIKGYERSAKKTLELLNDNVCWTADNLHDITQLQKAVKTCIDSKQTGDSSYLAKLVAEATIKSLPRPGSEFNIDNVRVCKLPGASLSSSFVVSGMLHPRDPLGTVRTKEATTPGGIIKVAVYTCGIEFGTTETKGTVLLHNAEELMSFATKEEEKMDETIKGIKDAGCEVIISGGNFSDVALHFCNKYNILCLKVASKFEQRRLCRSLKAIALARLGTPLPDEIGAAESVKATEYGSSKVTLIQVPNSKVSTIVLRGATPNLMEEVERAIDDAVQCVKAVMKDPRFLPGAGATEIELAHQLQLFAAKQPGVDQFAVERFGETLEIVPRVLSENAGHKHTDSLAALYAAHQRGKKTVGIDVTSCDSTRLTIDASEKMIYDHLATKSNAIRLAVDAALTVLRVDAIIMQKPAGGPNLDAAPKGGDDD